jgi:hypothetical protein
VTFPYGLLVTDGPLSPTPMPRNANPRYLDLATPVITGDDTHAALDTWAEVTGMSDANLRKYRSVLNRALSAAKGTSEEAVRTANVAMELRDLPVYARRLRDARDDESAAERLLEGLTGFEPEAMRRSIPVGAASCPEVRELLDAAPTTHTRNGLARVERAIVAAGYRISDDMDPVRLIEAGLELSLKTIAEDISYWRAASKRWAEANPDTAKRYGRIADFDHNLAVGLGRVDNLVELLRAAGYEGHPDDLSAYEQAALLAPKQHEQLEQYLKFGRTKAGKKRKARPISKAMKKDARRKFCLLVGLWCRYDHPSLLKTSRLSDYLLLDRPDRYAAAAPESDPFAEDGQSTGKATCPLLQYLLDESLADRLVNSPFKELFAAPDASQTLRYIPAMSGDLEVLWCIISWGYRGKVSAAKMADLHARHRMVRETLAQYTAQSGSEASGKDKSKLIKEVSYDLVVVLILPMLAREVAAAKAKYLSDKAEVERCERDPERDADVRRSKKAWRDKSLHYLALAVPIADGKRLANYEEGTLGPKGNFRPLWEGEVLLEMTCVWFREGSSGLLKDRHLGAGKPLERRTVLNPAIVDHAILTDWIKVHRVDALRASGVVDKGRYALFASPAKITPSETRGLTNLSERMGRALHHGMKKYLQRKLPAWEDRVSDGWRALFSEHVTRLLLVSSLGGTYEAWALAMRLTDDELATCQREYLAVSEMAGTLANSQQPWARPGMLESQLWRMMGFTREAREQIPTLFDPLTELLALDDAAPGTYLPAPIRDELIGNSTERKKRGKGKDLKKRKARPGQLQPTARAAA